MLRPVEASARAEGRLRSWCPWDLAGFSSLMAISLLVQLSVCPGPAPQPCVDVNTRSYSGGVRRSPPPCADLELCCLAPPSSEDSCCSPWECRGNVSFGSQPLQGLPRLQRAPHPRSVPSHVHDGSVCKCQWLSHPGLTWNDSEDLFWLQHSLSGLLKLSLGLHDSSFLPLPSSACFSLPGFPGTQ